MVGTLLVDLRLCWVTFVTCLLLGIKGKLSSEKRGEERKGLGHVEPLAALPSPGLPRCPFIPEASVKMQVVSERT